MFDRSLFIVKRKARRYRHWLEKLVVYPYPIEVSGRKYYLVDYTKFHRPTGTAVFSDVEEVTEDAKKAHRSLYQFFRLSEKIKQEGQMRAHVNLDFFRVPMSIMDEHPDSKWNDAYSFIKQFLSYQLTFKKTYDDFMKLIQNLKDENLPLAKEELELAIYTAAKLETIQLHVVKELSRNMAVLKQWREMMKSTGLWDKLKREQQVFYTQLMENEEFMEEEARKAKSDNLDDALILNQKEMANYMTTEQKADEDELRFP